MATVEQYGDFETAWCPGCGNFSILKTLKGTLADLNLEPHQVLLVSGIGQAAKTPHYLRCNGFNGLHGRSLPPAQAAKMAQPGLKVIAVSGDGCTYGEGGNHFLAAIRRNVDMTLFVHDNQIYGLTKGQASPTTLQGTKSKAQPFGAPSEAFNPVATAVAMDCSFVARSFSGDPEHLSEMMARAISHPGFALVDILQPCVSFNKLNTFAWYRERCYRLTEHDPTDREAAMRVALEFGDRIPLGVVYTSERKLFSEAFPPTQGEPLCKRRVDREALKSVLRSYI